MKKIKSGLCKNCIYWGVCGTPNRKESCDGRVLFSELKKRKNVSRETLSNNRSKISL